MGSTYSNVTTLINLNPPNSIDLSKAFSFNFNLNYSGGTWDLLTTQNPLPGLGTGIGESLDIWGLLGSITAQGPYVANQAIGTHYSGIFGQPLLNKQINILLATNFALAPLIANQSLTTAPNTLWVTAKGAALAIAAAVGINLNWAVTDASLNNFQLEGTMSAFAGLQSLASRVGATLRWNGGTNYTVLYPDQPSGSWSVPNCQLLTANGMNIQTLLDLQTGIVGSGSGVGQQNQSVVILPGTQMASNLALAGQYNTPNNGPQSNAASPAVTQVAKITKRLTSDDPYLVYDLPVDYDQVYIQILVPPGKDKSGQFVTNSPSDWFSYNVSFGLAQSPVQMTNVGGIYIPQVVVPYQVFPTNQSVQANHFVMTIACTRKQLGNASKTAATISLATDNLAKYYQSIRFAQTGAGTINCLFFGSIPLPGFFVSATAEGQTVQGICQSVSFSSPGILAIEVAQFTRVNFNVSSYNFGQNPSTLPYPYNTPGT